MKSIICTNIINYTTVVDTITNLFLFTSTTSQGYSKNVFDIFVIKILYENAKTRRKRIHCLPYSSTLRWKKFSEKWIGREKE